MVSPVISDAMTEHSMCHPGLPGPHLESHAGSPGLEAFQSAKSAGFFLDSCPRLREPSPSLIKDISPLFQGCNFA